MQIEMRVTQLVSAEALIGQAVDLLAYAARICRETGECDAPRKLYRAADAISSVIDGLRTKRGGCAPMSKPLIVVGVPTCRRPKMLARCLDSLGTQIADNFDIRIVVASNGADASRAVVERFKAWSLHPVEYLYDPVQSIARALNAVLDPAGRVGAQWVAFVDDDAVADPDWLCKLMAPQYLYVPVLMGTNVCVYPVKRLAMITPYRRPILTPNLARHLSR